MIHGKNQAIVQSGQRHHSSHSSPGAKRLKPKTTYVWPIGLWIKNPSQNLALIVRKDIVVLVGVRMYSRIFIPHHWVLTRTQQWKQHNAADCFISLHCCRSLLKHATNMCPFPKVTRGTSLLVSWNGAPNHPFTDGFSPSQNPSILGDSGTPMTTWWFIPRIVSGL